VLNSGKDSAYVPLTLDAKPSPERRAEEVVVKGGDGISEARGMGKTVVVRVCAFAINGSSGMMRFLPSFKRKSLTPPAANDALASRALRP
jgi:hypothetical protein